MQLAEILHAALEHDASDIHLVSGHPPMMRVNTVITPLDDTPAARAGLLSGDRIVSVDWQSLQGKKLVDVVKTLRGPPGSNLQLRVRRTDESIDISLTRAKIEVASVKTRWLEPGYAYIRISQFQNGTGEDFTEAIKGMQNEQHIEGLVLDLRNNPGGVLQASVTVADALLETGLIVYTEGRQPTSHFKYRATGTDLRNMIPAAIVYGNALDEVFDSGLLRPAALIASNRDNIFCKRSGCSVARFFVSPGSSARL